MQRPYFQIRCLHRCRGLGFWRIFCGGDTIQLRTTSRQPSLPHTSPPNSEWEPKTLPVLFPLTSRHSFPSSLSTHWAQLAGACGLGPFLWASFHPRLYLPASRPCSDSPSQRLKPRGILETSLGHLGCWPGGPAPLLRLVFCLLHGGDTWPLPTLVWVVFLGNPGP